jgi:dolichyl-phosphate beta-glucosyltransferase
MFREARRVPITLADLVPALRRGEHPSEVLLIDDGSDDATVEAVTPWLSGVPSGALQEVRVVRQGRNRGKGAAVRTGLGAARGQWRLLMDADNACRVDQAAKLLRAADRSGAGLIVGSRRARGAVVASKFSRRLAGAIFRACLWPLGLALARDTQCGFKLYRADLADVIARTAEEDRFAFDLEHLLIARRGGFGITEVGVAWTHVDGGTVRPIRDGLRMLARAVVIRLRHLGPVPASERARPSRELEAKPSATERAQAAAPAEPARI